jgi:hypothetical protein
MLGTGLSPMSDHHRKLERMYLLAPISRFYLPRIEVREAECEIWCDARSDMHHAAGGVHGSVFSKCSTTRRSSRSRRPFRTSSSLRRRFTCLLRPLTTGLIHSRGRVVRTSSTLSVAEAVLFDPSGREAARGIGDFVRSRIELTPALGYA